MATIIEYRVHPAVGIARMGDSKTTYFLTDEKPWTPIAPEQKIIPSQPNANPTPDRRKPGDEIRDKDKKLCKQGARFRVYGYQIEEKTVGGKKTRRLLQTWECTSATHKLDWSVQVANLKASTHPTDYHDPSNKLANAPDAIPLSSANGAHRNLHVFVGQQLGPLALRNPRLNLGSCFLDADGRLTVLGSDGKIQRFIDTKVPNVPRSLFWSGWEDDAADGPVKVIVEAKANNGKPDKGKPATEAIGGWVVISMPDYGADAQAPVDLYSLAVNHALSRTKGPKPVGDRPPNPNALQTYYQQIRPLQFSQYGVPYTITKYDRTAAAPARKPKHTSKPLNIPYAKSDQTFKIYLRPARKTRGHIPENVWTGTAPTAPPYPYQYIGVSRPPPAPPARPAGLTVASMPDLQFVAITEEQELAVQKWAAGTLPKGSDTAETSNKSNYAPYQLDRAHMESMSGGSFFPGIEVGRGAHYANVWLGRIGCDDNHYDARVTKEVDHAGTVIGDAKPGYLTRDLACPWHADFYACDDPWWPHSRPITVQTAAKAAGGWKEFMSDSAGPLSSFDRHVGDHVSGGLAEHWSKLGFVRYDFNSQELVEKERELGFGISNATVP